MFRTIMTLSALARESTVSSMDVLEIEPSIFCSDWAGVAEMPPNKTFVKDRFMATHWIRYISETYIRRKGAK